MHYHTVKRIEDPLFSAAPDAHRSALF